MPNCHCNGHTEHRVSTVSAEMDNRFTGISSLYVTIHRGQLRLVSSAKKQEIITKQSVVKQLSSWEIKAGTAHSTLGLNVSNAVKTV